MRNLYKQKVNTNQVVSERIQIQPTPSKQTSQKGIAASSSLDRLNNYSPTNK